MREDWTRTQATLTLREDEAAAMLAPAFGPVRIAALMPLSGGHANTNIRVRIDGPPHDVVLRLYQRDPGQRDKEAALARRLKGRVPVPDYLHCGEHDGRAYAAVAWIDGAPLQALARGASDAELATASGAVGRVLAAIHAVTFEGPGFLDGNLKVTPFPGGGSHAAFLAAMFAGLAGERLGRDLARDVVAFARANAARAAVWERTAVLTHFDFGPSNILMRDDFSLAAVLDWEFAAAAFPAADFGNLLRPPLGQRDAFVDAFANGYRGAGGFLPDDWRHLTRLADMGAWAEFLSRPDAGERVIADAIAALKATVGG